MSKSKKKKQKKVRPTSKFKEFVQSTNGRRLRGACYILLAIFLLVAIASFFIGWPSHDNWLGPVGYAVSAFFVQQLFGIASAGFSFMLFLYGVHLCGKTLMPIKRALLCTLFWMFWISTMLGYVAGRIGHDNETFNNYGGVTGYFVAEQLYRLIKWGTLVLILFLGGLMLYFVHKLRVKVPKIDVQSAVSTIKSSVGSLITPSTDKEETPEEEPETEQQPEARHRFSLFDKLNPEEKEEPETTPEPEPAAEQKPEIKIDINDRFVDVNKRAQKPGNEPSFTIADTGITPDEAPKPVEEELPRYSEFENVHTEAGTPAEELYDPKRDLYQFEMPDTSLMTDWEERNVKVTKEELIGNKDRIVETLRNYGIEITDITASPGPTVTLYEIKPAPGIRISKIKSLEDDIALSLSALGIRIIAPIPGKGTVGIEVPNTKPQVVSLKSMLESDAFRNCGKMELPIAFGKTISNEPYITDLAKMPHLLMAGATGTGKSVGLNCVIASLLYKKHPAELKFVMVDPKKVELSLYNKIERHYLAKMPDSEEAIITDVKKVVRTLNSLCIEMDQRYTLLQSAGVRKITEYNDKFVHRHLNPENGHRYLPYIVLVIDEFADLIMTAGKEVEGPICRLAQLARAVGIHLIIATQRPTTNIITGTIKANFPARVAFKVTSGIDSRTILDVSGAQRLIGRGDMLISLSGSELVRLQCALIETSEIEELADFIGTQRGYPDGFLLPEYLDENEEPNKDFDPKQKDEFFNDAARLVVASQFGSTSLLQRKLQLGYNRAGRIIDQLEAAGIVGPYNGSKAREVLIHDEVELEDILRSL